jgi:hypothetical protein
LARPFFWNDAKEDKDMQRRECERSIELGASILAMLT